MPNDQIQQVSEEECIWRAGAEGVFVTEMFYQQVSSLNANQIVYVFNTKEAIIGS